MSSEPEWIEKAALMELHDLVVAETGGAQGVRDEGLLDSALARPLNQHAYEGLVDPVDLAAAYAVAVAKNHPFADGNKRAGLMALGVFLALNGLQLTATDEDAIKTIYAVAASEMDADALADWVRKNSAPA
jgi:death-on-curing protein